jgi:hypothetical protein
MREARIRSQPARRLERDRIYLYLEPDIAERVRAYGRYKNIRPSAAAREIISLGLEYLDRAERERDRLVTA